MPQSGKIIHGDAKRGRLAPLYRIYSLMKNRCNNPNSKDYKWYGGKGVKVCSEWEDSYIAFKEWALSNGYKEGLTIDRIDSDGNYEPSNCRWVNMTVQNNNKKCIKKYEFNGESHSIAEWARILNLPKGLIKDRIHKLGWSIEKALSTPALPRGIGKNNIILEYNGESHPIGTWERLLGFRPETIRGRIKQGWSVEEALTIPVGQKRNKNN